MAEEDTRSLPGAAQAALRNRAVRAVLDGMTQAEAARVFRVHPNAVNRWIKRYREGGFQGLAEQRRGRRPGEQAGPRRTAAAGGHRAGPREHPRPARPGGVSVDPRCGRRADRPALWPVAGPHHGGRRICAAGGSAPSGHSTGPWSRTRWRWRRWLAEELPRHPRAGPRGRAGWCCGWTRWGCARMRPRAVVGAGRPDPGHQADRQAVPGQHDQRHLQRRDCCGSGCLSGSFNGPVFIDFLRRLLRDCGGRKVHLIVDGHPVHRAKLVSAWVGRHAEQIELHFLPGYSPELNPVELLNHDVKANAAGRRRPRSAGELREELHGYLRRRQRQPAGPGRLLRLPDDSVCRRLMNHTICLPQ